MAVLFVASSSSSGLLGGGGTRFAHLLLLLRLKSLTACGRTAPTVHVFRGAPAQPVQDAGLVFVGGRGAAGGMEKIN